MSMGSWYIIITKLLDQMKIMKQAERNLGQVLESHRRSLLVRLR